MRKPIIILFSLFLIFGVFQLVNLFLDLARSFDKNLVQEISTELKNLDIKNLAVNSSQDLIYKNFFKDDNYLIDIFFSDGNQNFEYIYSSNGTSIESINTENTLSIINAGYFDVEKNHVGYLKINEKVLFPNSANNPQITSYVGIEGDKIGIFQDFSLEENFTTVFQTGPMILKNGKILENEIKNSLNGNSMHWRSFIGKVDNTGRIFWGISRRPQSLTDLAKSLQGLEMFQDQSITVINLDGGSSIAFLENESGVLHGNEKILPNFLVAIGK